MQGGGEKEPGASCAAGCSALTCTKASIFKDLVYFPACELLQQLFSLLRVPFWVSPSIPCVLKVSPLSVPILPPSSAVGTALGWIHSGRVKNRQGPTWGEGELSSCFCLPLGGVFVKYFWLQCSALPPNHAKCQPLGAGRGERVGLGYKGKGKWGKSGEK